MRKCENKSLSVEQHWVCAHYQQPTSGGSLQISAHYHSFHTHS